MSSTASNGQMRKDEGHINPGDLATGLSTPAPQDMMESPGETITMPECIACKTEAVYQQDDIYKCPNCGTFVLWDKAL